MRISDLLSPVHLLLEGGNIFKDAKGNIITTSIKKNDIKSTLEWLERITSLPLVDNTLGSVGKKKASGDLDISVDETKISKNELVSRLIVWVKQQEGDPKEWIRKSGISVHFKTPIAGDSKNGYVQTDLMFHKDPVWMKFSMHSAGDASKFSGAERNMIMSSIAKSQGLKYSWQKGLIRREDETLISTDPNIIAQKLFGMKIDGAVFNSVESMQKILQKNPVLIKKLRDLQSALITSDINGVAKKSAQLKADNEESDRISKILNGIS